MVGLDFILHLVFCSGLVLILYNFQKSSNMKELYYEWQHWLLISWLVTMFLGFTKETIDDVNPNGTGFSYTDVLADFIGSTISYIYIFAKENIREIREERRLSKIIESLK